MKMILKVIAAPFALVLALLTALCWFLFDLCAFFLTIASVIVAVLGIGLFFTPAQSGFPAVQHSDQRTGYRL